MIPGSIKSFLEEEATVAVAGTRNGDNIPQVHRVSGWRVDPDGQAISCLIPASYAEELAANLQDNGRLALTLEQLGSHKTYQFKGDFLDSRPADDDDRTIAEQQAQVFGTTLGSLFGVPDEIGQAFMPPPSLVVRFTVREIFLQTPGPGAGQRLVPPEEQ